MVRQTEDVRISQVPHESWRVALPSIEPLSMSQPKQHSDLLFDFGPKGVPQREAPLDWMPLEAKPFDSQALDLPTFSLDSNAPLPALPREAFANLAPPPIPLGGFALDGNAVMCPCPDCNAPMSVRLWLKIADCWSCGISIELDEEQIREVERALEQKPRFVPPPPVIVSPAIPAPATLAPPVAASPIITPPVVIQPTTIAASAPVVAPVAFAPPPPAPVKPKSEAPSPAADELARREARKRREEREAASQKPSVEQRRPAPAAVIPVEAPVVPTPSAVAPAERRIIAPPPPPPLVKSEPRRAPTFEEEEDEWSVFRALFLQMPAWLLSFIVHLAAMVLLALLHLPEEKDEPTIMLIASIAPRRVDGGDVLIAKVDDRAQFDLPLPDKVDLKDPEIKKAALAANEAARELRIDPDEVDPSLPNLDTVKQRVGNVNGIVNGLAARDPRLRVELVRKEGGTTMTEAAVARSLRWFQKHQDESGKWSLGDFRQSGKCNCGHAGQVQDDTAGTSLALLPYLGAGQSHLVGIYKDEVAKGLRWLIAHQQPDGDLRTERGNSGMYAHGQASIVLCEAFAMTGDESLRAPAQKAIDFIVEAQYNDGGWRYTPKPRNQSGDTSVVGWQLMALQSARAANLTVPETTFRRAAAYLDKCDSRDGALYGYQPGSGPTPVMTAEGLLCRVYLGWGKDRPALGQGVNFLLDQYPPRERQLGIYYWYYATQTMHHYGGEPWEKWNNQMREVLTESQQKEGHAAGSWAPVGEHSSAGGRIYMTALSACTLEVYYRHLPIFRKIKVE